MSSSKPSRKKLWIILAVVVVAVIVVASVAFITRLPTFAPPAPSGPNVTIWNGTFCSDSGNCGYVPTVKTCDSAHYNSAGCPAQDAAGLDSFTSGPIDSGKTFSYTFTTTGTYYYYCTPHPWMRGEIIVE